MSELNAMGEQSQPEGPQGLVDARESWVLQGRNLKRRFTQVHWTWRSSMGWTSIWPKLKALRWWVLLVQARARSYTCSEVLTLWMRGRCI